jgi:nitrogen regulatory protein P-II 1
MKQITAVILPHMLTKVEHALHALPRCPGFTLLSAKGHSRGRAPGHAYRPTEQAMDLRARRALPIIRSEARAPSIVDAIWIAAHTGLSGDGIIAVCDATDVVRVGTGEIGDDAV